MQVQHNIWQNTHVQNMCSRIRGDAKTRIVIPTLHGVHYCFVRLAFGEHAIFDVVDTSAARIQQNQVSDNFQVVRSLLCFSLPAGLVIFYALWNYASHLAWGLQI